MYDHSWVPGNAGGGKQTVETGFRTPSPQRTGRREPVFGVALDLWDPPHQPQNSPRTSAQWLDPQPPCDCTSRAPSRAARESLRQTNATLLPLSPNRRVATFADNHKALYAMATSLPSDMDVAHMPAELGLTALVASVNQGMLSTFESLCDSYGPGLLQVAKSDFAWLVRVAASKGGDFARALLHRLPVEQWHDLLAEDAGSGFKSLLRHKNPELLTEMFAATPDEQLKPLLERSSYAVAEAMCDAGMTRALRPVLSRVNIRLL